MSPESTLPKISLTGHEREQKRRSFQLGLRLADAEALPFPEESFDVVVSLIGAMFAPRPELVASELLRVCVPGGTIAMANWTAAGFVGQMFKAIARFIAPANMPSPLLWGDEGCCEGIVSAMEFQISS